MGGAKLKHFKINDEDTNHAFTGEGFASFGGTPLCHSLESIHISGESMDQNGELAIGKGLAACNNLRKISFGCCGMCLGVRGIVELCKGCPLLEEIYLNFSEENGCCHVLSIHGIIQLIETFTTTLKRVVLLIDPTEGLCIQLGMSVDNLTLLRIKYPHVRIEIDGE